MLDQSWAWWGGAGSEVGGRIRLPFLAGGSSEPLKGGELGQQLL